MYSLLAKAMGYPTTIPTAPVTRSVRILFTDRIYVEPKPDKKKFVPPSDPIFKNRPLLAIALCDAWWDDGAPRDPYTLAINWHSGSCMLTLVDKPEERSTSTLADSLEEALDLVEGLLARPRMPWRAWGKKGGKKSG